MVIDDEPNIRLAYRCALESEGYLVDESDAGGLALARSRTTHFDLFLIDLNLRGVLDGLDVLQHLRESGITSPTVVITAHGSVPHAVRAMKLGAIDFLEKPVLPAQLREAVARALSHVPAPAEPQPEQNSFAYFLDTAKSLIRAMQFPAASEYLAEALRLDCRSPEAHNLAGVLAEMREQYDKAGHHYTRAVALDPNYQPAEQNLRRLKELDEHGSSAEPINFGVQNG